MMRHVRRADVKLIAIILGSVLLSLLVLGDLYDRQQTHREVTGLSTALDAQRRQAQEAGQTPVARAPDAVKASPDQPTISPTPAPSSPTAAQVYAAVSAYFQAHPVRDGQDVSPARLAASVANYLRRHPPGPAQLAAAVAAYLSANPPPSGSPGKDGRDGTDGQNATPEMVAAAVQQYMQDHPLPVCPDGTHFAAHTLVADDDHNPLTTQTVEAVVCEKD